MNQDSYFTLQKKCLFIALIDSVFPISAINSIYYSYLLVNAMKKVKNKSRMEERASKMKSGLLNEERDISAVYQITTIFNFEKKKT